MLIDFLSPSNQITFNIQVAKSFDLYTAIYINQLLDINEKAIRKKKINDGFFSVDREYIESRTTLSTETQVTIDENLSKLNLLTKSDNGSILLNIEKLMLYVSNDDIEFKNDIRESMKPIKSSRISKKKGNIEILKKEISSSFPEDMQLAWFRWIETIVDKYGPQSKVTLSLAIDSVNKYANHDADKAVDIIKYATAYGYLKINNAIKSFELFNKNSNKNIHSTIGEVEVKLSDKVY